MRSRKIKTIVKDFIIYYCKDNSTCYIWNNDELSLNGKYDVDTYPVYINLLLLTIMYGE